MTNELRAKREALEHLWRQGLAGRSLLTQYTEFIDYFVTKCFAQKNGTNGKVSLVALGGYGRGELSPYSDIDIMLLYERGAKKSLTEITEAVLYPLWDGGLEVGHAVRTIKECLVDADSDFLFQVSMLDARLLTGSQELYIKLIKKFKKKYIEGKRKTFLDRMLFHREERLRKFGIHSYMLEPNIKECHGGLRDVHAMLWTGNVLFGMKKLQDFEDAGIFTSAEREDFQSAWEQLIRIRNRLHYLSGRKNDQLFFEHQEDIAKALDYRDDNSLLGVEYFMRDVHSFLQTIALGVDIFFEHAEESTAKPLVFQKPTIIRPGISIRNNRIHLGDPELLSEKPDQILQLFALSAKTGHPIHYWTRKLISSRVHLITEKHRNSFSVGKTFLDILMNAVDPQNVLSSMLETGLLSAYIPEFKNVLSLAQHDVYHIFTVDRHLLQTVVELHKLQSNDPFFKDVTKPQVLFLAGLIHDVGKGSGKDHSEYGAELSGVIGKRLGMDDADINDLQFLVSKHLNLIKTAQRRDLEDEQFIVRYAQEFKNHDQLVMLYLLSIADARATGPTVWNEWKNALLLEFFLKITNAFDQSSNFSDQDRLQGVEWMRAQLTKLAANSEKLNINTLPEDYLLSFSPEIITKHITLRKEIETKKVAVLAEQESGSWTLTIVANDCTGLLAKICGVLALHNINILNAQINTWADGTAVDVFNVKAFDNMQYSDHDWLELAKDLTLALENKLGLLHRLAMKLKSPGRRPPKKGAMKSKPKVQINNTASETYTVIEVFSEDRPGLLYAMTRTLSDFGVNISQAKIGTERDLIVDVFYALGSTGDKITDRSLQNELKEALIFTAKEWQKH